ncbi:hypothetical protein GB931_21785 [Modestobacter sp. I12A-02628]|uniref:Uncharacterized protein n=1 Tax=Goekera deserti TaxID=2497753 RepID=A0A7K3WBD0_9ACTN|nr:hypothetical protein [Goekera deserti]MPR00506.1 hypothetical protein [Goekera deserti]NDI49095.1 hypothetical protein [Goekera deserti]NEL52833.1 hypothetical protein [Goekera deserti]
MGRHAAGEAEGTHPLVAAALARRAAVGPARVPSVSGGPLGWPGDVHPGSGLGWPGPVPDGAAALPVAESMAVQDRPVDVPPADAPPAGPRAVRASAAVSPAPPERATVLRPAPRGGRWRRFFVGGRATSAGRDTSSRV